MPASKFHPGPSSFLVIAMQIARRPAAQISSVWMLLLAWLLLAAPVTFAREPEAGPRERGSLDAGWRFALGHASDPAVDFGFGTRYFTYLAKTGFGDGAADPAFDDRAWRLVNLPHDWAVEVPFDPAGIASHGFKAVGRGFPASSIGWYRRSFPIAASDLGRRIRIEFDGVYRNARVFINGFLVGEEPSGYLGASYDISDYLNYGGDNVVAVRVDATMEEGWFYEGAGIYRHVWLSKTAPLHVARDGVWIRTAMDGADALVTVDTTLGNESRQSADLRITQSIVDSNWVVLARGELAVSGLVAGAERTASAQLRLKAPALWSPESPTLYTLVTQLEQGAQVLDRVSTRFGVRTLRFDPNAGFFLNGRHVVLKGTNNHQDHAGVGVALPDALQDYRIQLLKQMGSNAYRCSHNPPTPELLDACDRLGMLVIDENRLMGSNPMHLGQVERLILRDRNHPSVIMWSLGNEEWRIESNIKGARIAQTMQDFAKRLDPTRIMSVAISGGWGGISSVIDAPGVNYIRQGDTDRQHAQYPHQFIVGTEETTTQATRGVYLDDRAACHLSPQIDGSSGGNAEKGWKHYAARPFTGGVFFWTGFDYRGEPTPFGFAAISTQFGILDTCGFPKDGYYYLKSWWGPEPVLHVFPHWNWPGREGQEIEVTVNSNFEEVELELNGTSCGRQRMEANSHLTWRVAYAPGRLVARGYSKGVLGMTTVVETTGAPASIALAPNRHELTADGRDVVVFTVEARDQEGRPVPTAGVPVEFELTGPAKIIGVGNGDPSCLEPDVYFESVRTIKLGTWQAPDAAPNPNPIVFEAQFDAPEVAPGGTVQLLLNTLGPRQTVELNGVELYRARAPAESRATIDLDRSKLKARGNLLRIVSGRYEDRGDREALAQIHPATLRLANPPGPWRRSTFNGLAQVIVESTGREGEVTLVARSKGLVEGRSQLSAIRPPR
jgi:beta-galactosidase